jgi:hypothetical protein
VIKTARKDVFFDSAFKNENFMRNISYFVREILGGEEFWCQNRVWKGDVGIKMRILCGTNVEF